MRFEPGKRLGSYEILSPVGAGGMGEVYRARDLKLDREVAIKVLSADLAGDRAALARFEREAKALAALSHPNVLSVHDYGVEGNDWYLVTELLEGRSLRATLAQVSNAAGPGSRPPLAKAIEWSLAIAQGLAAAHTRGLVHRDLKPENVFITNDGLIKVLDFGLVRDRSHDGAGAPTRTPVSGLGIVVGSMPYMSPEQAQGQAVDQRSDIFSFGTMLYEIVAGRHPFLTGSALQTTQRIVEADPDPVEASIPDAPLELRWIIAKCLAKDPAERYQTSSEMVVDLQRVKKQIDSGVSGVQRTEVIAPAQATQRKWPVLAAAMSIVAVIAAGLAAWMMRGPAGKNGPAPVLSMQPLTASGNVIDAAISPDGKYLAYVESEAGLQTLFLKQIATGTSIALMKPSPVETWGITFSPDGSSIYFPVKTANDRTGTLLRIAALGGPATTLVSGIDGVVSFSRDGSRIAFVRVGFPSVGESSVMVAHTDGSDARPVATRKYPLEFAPGFFQSVDWSSDDTSIYAGIRDAATNVTRIARLAVADGSELPFAFAPERPFLLIGNIRVLRDGGLLFVGSTTMGALALFAGAEQLWILPEGSSIPRRITGELESFRAASISVDERALVTVTTTGFGTLYRSNADGSDPRRVLSSRGEAMTQVGPIGDRLLFRSVGPSGSDLWTMDVDGNDRRQLTSDGLTAWPAASPDGRLVAFISGRNGGYHLWIMDADGRNARQLVSALPGRPAVSPDGTWVAFSGVASAPPALWRVPTDGAAPVKLVEGRTTFPAISPDGRQIAFVRPVPDRPPELTVINSETGLVLRHLPLSVTGFPLGIGCTVRWAPDAKALFHSCGPGGFDIWRQPLDRGPARILPRFGDNPIANFAVMNDGTLVVQRALLARDARLVTNFR